MKYIPELKIKDFLPTSESLIKKQLHKIFFYSPLEIITFSELVHRMRKTKRFPKRGSLILITILKNQFRFHFYYIPPYLQMGARLYSIKSVKFVSFRKIGPPFYSWRIGDMVLLNDIILKDYIEGLTAQVVAKILTGETSETWDFESGMQSKDRMERSKI